MSGFRQTQNIFFGFSPHAPFVTAPFCLFPGSVKRTRWDRNGWWRQGWHRARFCRRGPVWSSLLSRDDPNPCPRPSPEVCLGGGEVGAAFAQQRAQISPKAEPQHKNWPRPLRRNHPLRCRRSVHRIIVTWTSATLSNLNRAHKHGYMSTSADLEPQQSGFRPG